MGTDIMDFIIQILPKYVRMKHFLKILSNGIKVANVTTKKVQQQINGMVQLTPTMFHPLFMLHKCNNDSIPNHRHTNNTCNTYEKSVVCGVIVWYEERTNKRTEFGQLGVHFRKNILVYNYMFTYTSMGSRVDRSINRTKCPYGKTPQLRHVRGIYEMLDKHNVLVKSFCIYIYRERERVNNHKLSFSYLSYHKGTPMNTAKNGLQRITNLHLSFISMTYPLIQPYEEDGCSLGIRLVCIQQRLNEGEEERFRYIRNNQPKHSADSFWGLMDSIVRGDFDCSQVGKTIILPSSHIGSREDGYPNLFLTFILNPNDIICRVFQIKLAQLMHQIKKDEPFGTIMIHHKIYIAKNKGKIHNPIRKEIRANNCDPVENIYTIDFKKRGLPHAHILLFLHESLKSPAPEHIDILISAVKNFTIRRPSGQLNPRFPLNTGIEVKKNGASLDNRYVVQYNRNFTNYLFKYVHKGSDRCRYISYRKPTVERLPFHLEGQNTIIFEGSSYRMSDFPTRWVWNKKNTHRKNGQVVGRIYLFVKGCTSFESIRRINGDDKNWNDCFLFVTVNYEILLKDITSMNRKRFKLKHIQLTQKQIESYSRLDIENILLKRDRCFRDIEGMQFSDTSLMCNENSKMCTQNHFPFIFIVLLVATSGIESFFLPNGRTTHSLFHIPLDVTAIKNCFEVLDKTLRDILRDRYENILDKLPVVQKGTTSNIMDELKENMRLTTGKVIGSKAVNIESFDKWFLEVGDGSIYVDNKKELIKFLHDVCIPMSHNHYNNPTYLKERNQTHKEDIFYPTKILNKLLKCNGTRLIITHLGKWVTITRIVLTPSESKWTFKMNRHELPSVPSYSMTINKIKNGQLYVEDTKDHTYIKIFPTKKFSKYMSNTCGNTRGID
uniref:ATP-dependent DNA helicase n=1 Tax=Solanum lycopersicum TaxID=4081 RepID=A0A3Q7GHN3_SOLLC